MLTPTDSPAIARNAAPYLHGPETTALAAALEAGQYGHNTETEAFEQDLAAFLGVADVQSGGASARP